MYGDSFNTEFERMKKMRFFKTVSKEYSDRETALSEASWQQFCIDRCASTEWCMTFVRRFGRGNGKKYKAVTLGFHNR